MSERVAVTLLVALVVIDVNAQDTSLMRNVANHNADLGIEEVTGVHDGGGNRADGNGNPLQCTGVSC